MPRTSDQTIATAKKGVDVIVRMYRLKMPRIWREMVNVIENKQEFLRVLSQGSLPTATALNQASGVTYFDYQIPWSLDIPKVKRQCGFAESFETDARDIFGLLKDKKAMITRSIEKGQEADIATFMNLATTGGTNFLCPDGLSWINTAHLLQSGTFSNQLSTGAPLTSASLTQALWELWVQPDHSGDPMQFNQPVDLWVHPANQALAVILKNALNAPTTANLGDPNVSGKMINKIVVNSYFTNPANWMIVVSGEQNPFIYVDEDPGRFEMTYDQDHDIYKCVMFAEWGKAMIDARGAVFSPGI